MKNLLTSLSIILFTTAVSANEQLQFVCQNNQQQAYLTFSNDRQTRQSTSRECNGGVGDDFTDCRDVTYSYEDRTVWVTFDQATVSFTVTRLLSRHLFAGKTSEIVLTNSKNSYALSLRTTAGWVLLPCKETQ